MTDSDTTFRRLVTSFTDFLTVAIHTILYERNIYPSTSFLSARKYNFPVRQNRHPKVCEWINDAVAAVETELLKCSVDRVAVVLHSPNNSVLERYVLDVSRLPTISSSDIDITLQREGLAGDHVPILPVVDMGEEFRAALNQLTIASSRLKPLPAGCSFTVAIELKEEGQAPLGYPQSWLAAPRERRSDASGAEVVPVRTVSAGEMIFETWIEQARPA